jgi:hypothetical protein
MNFIYEDTIQLSKLNSEWSNTLYALSLTFYSISTKGKKKLSKKERKTVFLSDIITQALVDIMLGDGHIQQRSVTSNSRFLFTQISVKHRNYYQKASGFAFPHG